MGASLLWSCAGGIDPTDSEGFPGANAPNSGAAGAPVSGAAGHGGSAGSAKTTSGAAGQPVSGAAGQGGSATPTATGAAGSDSVTQPTTGAAGSGAVVPPTTGAAGSDTVAPPTTGGAGSGNVTPPTTGAAGSGTVAPPTTGAAGSGAVVTPTTGAAGSGTVAPPTTGAAGSGAVAPPTTGAAGSASVAPPTTGAAGQAGTAVVTPPPGGTTGTAPPPPTTPPPTTPTTTAGSTIVPLYTSPGDASWNTVIAAKMAHPKVGVIAIVNPNNGPGGATDSAYASGIAKLTAAGIRVIGYVATGYTANSPASVKADIDRWKAFYPGQVTGIFFDEQSNKAEHVAYYRDLSQYTKAQGLSFTVGNPGTDTAQGFVGALDMMLIYESAGLPSQNAIAGWHASFAPSNFGIIPYATTLDATWVRNARKYVQYIYLQSDNLPNPWDSVPGYFSDLLAALE